jgi:hypothetical protein
MITLTTTSRITLRSRSIQITGQNTVITDVMFCKGEYRPLLQNEEVLTFCTQGSMTGKRITPPILYQLIANTNINVLIKFKGKHYIVGKNLIFSYDMYTRKAVPLMLHIVKTGTRSLREGKIVMNPSMFQIDSAFHKLFEIILRTGVDVELTKFIEEKYYFTLNLPKFGKPADRVAYINDYKSWAMEMLVQKSEI